MRVCQMAASRDYSEHLAAVTAAARAMKTPPAFAGEPALFFNVVSDACVRG
jgi:hypothetical protein